MHGASNKWAKPARRNLLSKAGLCECIQRTPPAGRSQVRIFSTALRRIPQDSKAFSLPARLVRLKRRPVVIRGQNISPRLGKRIALLPAGYIGLCNALDRVLPKCRRKDPAEMPFQIRLTSETFWWSALVLLIVDFSFLMFLAQRVQPGRFRQLRWPLAAASTIVWSVLWSAALWAYWSLWSSYVFPGWARWVAPFSGLFFGLIAMAFWWLALHLPGRPAVIFPLLGVVLSFPAHSFGIYKLQVLTKVPLVQGVSPASVLVFGTLEHILYWSIALSFALLLRRLWRVGIEQAAEPSPARQ